MAREHIAFTDTIDFSLPVALSVGGRTVTIEPPASLLHKRIHFQVNDDLELQYISPEPIRRKVRLVVGGVLLASALVDGRVEAGKLAKHDDGSIQLNLEEKYTRFNRRHPLTGSFSCLAS